MNQEIKTYQNAVEIIKTAILQSQARAAKAVNQVGMSQQIPEKRIGGRELSKLSATN